MAKEKQYLHCKIQCKTKMLDCLILSLRFAWKLTKSQHLVVYTFIILIYSLILYKKLENKVEFLFDWIDGENSDLCKLISYFVKHD